MKATTLCKDDFHYPSAIEWMWNTCTPLGKFTNSEGQHFDLGIACIGQLQYSAAIVYDNEPGDYYSGNLHNRGVSLAGFVALEEVYTETYKRALEAGYNFTAMPTGNSFRRVPVPTTTLKNTETQEIISNVNEYEYRTLVMDIARKRIPHTKYVVLHKGMEVSFSSEGYVDECLDFLLLLDDIAMTVWGLNSPKK